MMHGYVVCTKEEMTLQEFHDLIAKQYLDKRYMPNPIETASGYKLSDIPDWHGKTSAFVVYCNVRTMLSTIRNLSCVREIYDNADGKVNL